MQDFLWLANIFAILVAIFLLWKGAQYLVETASKIAAQFGMSDLVIGLTVVAIGTSAPEFVVSVGAALADKPNIAVANVVGSNIFNLGLILGFGAIFQPIKTSPTVLYRDALMLLFSAGLVYFFLFNIPFIMPAQQAALSVIESSILILVLVSYLIFLIVTKDTTHSARTEHRASRKDFLILIGSMIALGVGGQLLVDHSTSLARQLNVSDWWIGLTVVAIGTSSPEIATTCLAMIYRKSNIALGNLLGSDLFNLLGVIGVAGLFSGGLYLDGFAIQSFNMLLGSLLILLLFIRSGWKISRTEGILLLLLNSLRWLFV